MKYISSFMFIIICTCIIYANSTTDTRTMKLVLTKNENDLVFYQGPIKKSIMLLLDKARRPWFIGEEKEAVKEGVYYIEITNGSMLKKYSIQNNYWIYDHDTGKFLRCEMLTELRGQLIQYLLAHGTMSQ